MTDETHLTWGDALVLKVHRTRHGMKPCVAAIQEAVGPWIGSRTTFAKLYDVDRPDDLDASEAFRAWLLLTALGEDPAEWGIQESAVPRGFVAEQLRAVLRDLVGDAARHRGLAALAVA
jgi:hypothetical protein